MAGIENSLTLFQGLGKPILERYRTILSWPTWGYVKALIIRTRDYERGLEGARLLLTMTDFLKSRLSPLEYETNRHCILYFICDLLDRTDRIVEFMELYKTLQPWDNRKFGSHHLLWEHIWLKWRSSVVEKKLTRFDKGYKIHRHHSQEKLSDEEIETRFNWICSMANENIKKGEFNLCLLLLSAAGFILWSIMSAADRFGNH